MCILFIVFNQAHKSWAESKSCFLCTLSLWGVRQCHTALGRFSKQPRSINKIIVFPSIIDKCSTTIISCQSFICKRSR